MGHIELLETDHPADGLREGPHQAVVAHIEDGDVDKAADVRRKAGLQAVVHEDDLVEVGHVDEAGRYAAVKLVVGEDDDRHRRVAEVVRDVEVEAVAVDEDSVEVLVKELLGDGPFELVEPQIQELERREREDHARELAGEPVVAQI